MTITAPLLASRFCHDTLAWSMLRRGLYATDMPIISIRDDDGHISDTLSNGDLFVSVLELVDGLWVYAQTGPSLKLSIGRFGPVMVDGAE